MIKILICISALLLLVSATFGRSPEGRTGDCGKLASRFDVILEKAGGTCRTAADCGCYNPVSPNVGCGGVTDRKTVKELSRVETEFHRIKCSWPVDCAAWLCKPACVRGKCR
ncbi:MAG: hypothetical protein MUD12_17135 [Spirochaetes bacterium]|jgi:hypothetical protein|nr:hypothetical protein [Spirochaetota bacterium]